MAVKVAIGYCHNGFLHEPMVRSMYNFMIYDMRRRHVFVNGGAVCTASSAYIPDARNLVVAEFLRHDYDWLWFLDHDMIFPPDTLYHLLDAADPVERPIMGALYFTNITFPVDEEDVDRTGALQDIQLPVFLDPDFHPLTKFNVGGDDVYELGGTGMGCTIIHRSVLEKMNETYEPPWKFFGHDHHDGRMAGEDITFCKRARALGFKTYGYCGVPIEHIKSHTLNLKTFMQHHNIQVGQVVKE